MDHFLVVRHAYESVSASRVFDQYFPLVKLPPRVVGEWWPAYKLALPISLSHTLSERLYLEETTIALKEQIESETVCQQILFLFQLNSKPSWTSVNPFDRPKIPTSLEPRQLKYVRPIRSSIPRLLSHLFFLTLFAMFHINYRRSRNAKQSCRHFQFHPSKICPHWIQTQTYQSLQFVVNWKERKQMERILSQKLFR